MTIMKWRISGQGYKHLTRFSKFALSKAAASTTQNIDPVDYFNLCHLYTSIFCYLRKIIKIGFPELEKKFSHDFALFK